MQNDGAPTQRNHGLEARSAPWQEGWWRLAKGIGDDCRNCDSFRPLRIHGLLLIWRMSPRSKKSRRRAPSRNRSWGLVVRTAFAAVLITGLVILTRGADSGSGVETAPDVTLLYFDGATENLSDLVGQPVVLNFWASWCPACISEMPAIAEADLRFGDRVRFVGLNMQEVNLDAAIDLAGVTGVEYQLAHDPDGAIFREFGGLAMPTTIFIDADGSVARVHSGAIFSDDLTAIIENELLG